MRIKNENLLLTNVFLIRLILFRWIRALSEIAEGLVAIKRIQRYLESEEKDTTNQLLDIDITPDKSPKVVSRTISKSISRQTAFMF